MQESHVIGQRSSRLWRVLKVSVRAGAHSGLHTVRMLLGVMIPVMIIMTALEGLDVLRHIAWLFAPVMRLLGLPGDAALAFISGSALNLYSATAVAANIALTARQMTILAILCLICHNLPVECAVQKKAGTSVWAMLGVRVLTGFGAALTVSRLIPDTGAWAKLVTRVSSEAVARLTLTEFLLRRARSNGLFLLNVILIVMGLMILMEFLRQTGVLRVLTVMMRPVTWLAGLPRQAGFTVMTSTTLGLAYGAGTVIAESKQGHLSSEEQFRTNVLIGTTHSLFEDTLLFVVLGASFTWIVLARLVIGSIAVRVFAWTRRLCLRRTCREGPPPGN